MDTSAGLRLLLDRPLSCPVQKGSPASMRIVSWNWIANFINVQSYTYFQSFFASDFVTRQCLADGNWFSCPSKAPPNATLVANGFSAVTTTATTAAFNPGWTNYTSCYTETTLKLFNDLDYETGCPKGEVAVDSEVKVRADDICKAENILKFLTLGQKHSVSGRLCEARR